MLGIAAGAWLGAGMIGLYNQYFRFPVLGFRLSGAVAPSAVAFGLGVAAASGPSSRSGAPCAIPPAEAMRPEAPARYRPEPGRTAGRPAAAGARRRAWCSATWSASRCARGGLVGIAFGGADAALGFGFIDAMDRPGRGAVLAACSGRT